MTSCGRRELRFKNCLCNVVPENVILSATCEGNAGAETFPWTLLSFFFFLWLAASPAATEAAQASPTFIYLSVQQDSKKRRLVFSIRPFTPIVLLVIAAPKNLNKRLRINLWTVGIDKPRGKEELFYSKSIGPIDGRQVRVSIVEC